MEKSLKEAVKNAISDIKMPDKIYLKSKMWNEEEPRFVPIIGYDVTDVLYDVIRPHVDLDYHEFIIKIVVGIKDGEDKPDVFLQIYENTTDEYTIRRLKDIPDFQEKLKEIKQKILTWLTTEQTS